MKAIVCIDDRNGMMFNNRRQSRDERVIEDIIKMSEGTSLWMNEYSAKLFSSHSDKIMINSSFPDMAEGSDYCFIEDIRLINQISSVDEFIVYKWNREYPADVVFNINLYESGFELQSTEEFGGRSHEKITKEIYVR